MVSPGVTLTTPQFREGKRTEIENLDKIYQSAFQDVTEMKCCRYKSP